MECKMNDIIEFTLTVCKRIDKEETLGEIELC